MLEVEDDISRFGKRSSRSGGSLGERSLAVVAFGSVTMIGSHRSGRYEAHILLLCDGSLTVLTVGFMAATGFGNPFPLSFGLARTSEKRRWRCSSVFLHFSLPYECIHIYRKH